MPLPEGFKKISPMPWKHTEEDEFPVVDPDDPDDVFRGDTINRVSHAGYSDGRYNTNVCNDVAYYPAPVSSNDQKLIARAPDHALLLAAIVQGVVEIDSESNEIFVYAKHMTYSVEDPPLDEFGCPKMSLTSELRAAIIAALEGQP